MTSSDMNPNITGQSFFNGAAMLGNLDELTHDQLKDRLAVAETLLKKLYDRNKDVELYHK